MSETLPPLRLKKNEERRIRAGHVWVYSNEVDNTATPLKAFTPGQAVQVQAHNGKSLGNGYVNPASLICARLVSRDPNYVLDRSLIVHRLKVALSLREFLFDRPFYRLVYGESDQLPGLVIDRYDDICVVQLTTAGMEAVREQVLEALDKVIHPKGVVLRCDSSIRKFEGLDSYTETLGDVPEHIKVEEAGLGFDVSLQQGQKTGWFYDQRMNRIRLRAYAKEKRVLDVFSYVGGWGLQAAAGGASEVFCVDASEQALDRVHANAQANGFGDKVASIQGDAFEVLSQLRVDQERFDVVVLDPPAFIKRRKDNKAGEQAYHRINQLGMQVLKKDGILVSASCSHHLGEEQFQKILLQSSRHLDRSLQILERGHQAPDHPLHPAIPETAYLKALFCRVLPS
ncbi:SAM-dependent methyltransferase [Thiogranum longum]|uniref:SAM-dependent methyltransferase n=1 Tax=Thiogranum longum TaxID=1537524 RepID=A0A4R1HPV1_9GAMM|nr:class I SAM-dependent rRNA methyltransferase [Thiogranum longum]TCK19332.1 SAM-dependent methyltransferase [Thiogranum longum]